MVPSIQVLTLAVVAVALSAALAHALEMPGKMRLTKDEYFVVQSIYYPGFTIAGAAEPLAIILLLILVVLTPDDQGTWFLEAALLASVAMHTVYWLVTHPLNRVWLDRTERSEAGLRFFSVGARRGEDKATVEGWMRLRDRWEYSHVVRAILAAVSFIALALATCMA
jgi:hypothetical protein